MVPGNGAHVPFPPEPLDLQIRGYLCIFVWISVFWHLACFLSLLQACTRVAGALRVQGVTWLQVPEQGPEYTYAVVDPRDEAKGMLPHTTTCGVAFTWYKTAWCSTCRLFG